MKKKVLAAIIIAMGVLTACGNQQIESPIITVEPEPIATATPEPIESSASLEEPTEESTDLVLITDRQVVDGKKQSYLTGEWKDAAVVDRRNMAVMVSNNKPALPQHGISQASIIYEAPMEAGTCTRLMCVFEDYDDLDFVGPVRSSRDYFVYEAMAFDSIYVNWGLAVPYVAPVINTDRIDNVSQAVAGMEKGVASAAFERYSRPGYATEYTGCLVVDQYEKAVDRFDYAKEYTDRFVQTFTFADSEAGKRVTYDEYPDATKIMPGGTADNSGGYQEGDPYFVYDEEDGLYYRFQNGGMHIDEMNNEQLAVSNVVFKVCYGEERDAKGYLAFGVHGEGDAYVFTNGKVIKGTWKRNSDYEPNMFYDENGNEIILNQGKTWICNIWQQYQSCMSWE